MPVIFWASRQLKTQNKLEANAEQTTDKSPNRKTGAPKGQQEEQLSQEMEQHLARGMGNSQANCHACHFPRVIPADKGRYQKRVGVKNQAHKQPKGPVQVWIFWKGTRNGRAFLFLTFKFLDIRLNLARGIRPPNAFQHFLGILVGF